MNKDLMKVLIALLLLPIASFAQQAKGIRFAQDLSWAQVLAKAKQEHKLVFLDCYASWCGPCKLMERTTYLDEGVVKVMNSNFIAFKLQLDKTSHDNEEVKSHYSDAQMISGKYPVNAYPTFLFFDPEGNLVHKGLGYLPAGPFLELVHSALDPDKQYYTLLAKYRSGRLPARDQPGLALAAADFGEDQLAAEVAGSYIHQELPKLSNYDPEILRFLSAFTQSSADPGFRYFRDHAEEADRRMGKKNFAEEVIDRVVMKEDIHPGTDGSLNQAAMRDTITRKYGALTADRVISKAVIYRNYGKDWPVFTAALVHYTDTYEDHGDLALLHKNAGFVLEHSTKPNELKSALAWSKLTLEKDPSNEHYQKQALALAAKLADIEKGE